MRHVRYWIARVLWSVRLKCLVLTRCKRPLTLDELFRPEMT